jgi:hypothetical protein
MAMQRDRHSITHIQAGNSELQRLVIARRLK